MNRKISIIAVFFIVAITKMISQNDKKASFVSSPSDVNTGYTYDFDKAQKLILDRIQQPNVYNADAQAVIESPGFPKFKSEGSTVNPTDKELLNLWMEKNPEIIIKAFKNRNDIVKQY